MKLVPDFIKVDFWRKLISLIFAILIWWRISIQIGSEEVVRNVPIRIIDSSQALFVEPQSLPDINLIVKTTSHKRLLLAPSDFRVEIRLPARDPGGLRMVEYNIERDAEIKKPFGVKILSIEPSKISFFIDRQSRKTVPVIARFSGTLSDDYACGEVKLIPEQIELQGPESLLNNISRVNTEPILLDSSIKEDFERVIRIESPNQRISFIPEKVSAIVEIYRKHERRTFRGLPVMVLNQPDSQFTARRLYPTNVDIIVSGPKSLVETMRPSDLIPFVRFDGTAEKDAEFYVQCYTNSPEIKILSINPASVKLSVIQEKTKN